MSVHNLRCFFEPKSIALVGPMRERISIAVQVGRNLMASGFDGPVWMVDSHATNGASTFGRIADLPQAPDLAVLATPHEQMPQAVAELGERGVKAAIVMSGHLEYDVNALALEQRLLDIARRYGLRLVGPDSAGIVAPPARVNASFIFEMPIQGHVALITQTAGLMTAIADWSVMHHIGYSHLVSLGAKGDVDFADMLDYLAAEPNTHMVLLVLEDVRNGRKFMSAARRCARVKPVIVVKSGRFDESERDLRTHTGELACEDVVYDAALRRAGVLRVDRIEDLFHAGVSVLQGIHVKGDRLGIITNGRAAATLAADCLLQHRGRLAVLGEDTLKQIDRIAPRRWSGANPVVIGGDAEVKRYCEVTEAVAADPATDAVMVIHCPLAFIDSIKIADAIIRIDKRTDPPSKPVIAAWLGESASAPARARFAEARVPCYTTPEDAVTAFLRLARFERARELLVEAPPARPMQPHDRARAHAIVAAALADNRTWLSPLDVHGILESYGIPTVALRYAATPRGAALAASELGGPVALKVVSPDVVFKADVGGVVLHLAEAEAVQDAAEQMMGRIREKLPGARVEGFLVQPMVLRPRAHELIVGLVEDAVFGPVVLFGHGGTGVLVIADRAVALPPLNAVLARDLISRTRVARLLAGYRDRPQADIESIVDVILAVQDIAIDLPQIKEMDINPLLADGFGVVALDARIRIAPAPQGTDRFAIKPYPEELSARIETRLGKSYELRPIKPEDADGLKAMYMASDPRDVQMRFFARLTEVPDSLAKRLTQIDYDREMAFVAIDPDTARFAGVVRLDLTPDRTRGEFTIMVRSDAMRRGLGLALSTFMLDYARKIGVKQVYGDVMAQNQAMLHVSRHLNARLERGSSPNVVHAVVEL